MKNYFRLLLLLAVLSSVALARSLPYVPDYFPSGLGSGVVLRCEARGLADHQDQKRDQ